jgi:hypothetical protein
MLGVKCLERGCKGGFQGPHLRQGGCAIKWNGFVGRSEDTSKFTQVWNVIPSCMSSKVRKHSMGIPDAEGWFNGYGKEGHICVKDF